MGKRCCKRCPGSSFCGCCCTKRFATFFFSVVGLVLAVAAIVPPVYIYTTDKDYSKLFPAVKLSKALLERMTETYGGVELDGVMYFDNGETEMEYEEMETAEGKRIVTLKQTPREKYKLAIFQLLDDIDGNAECMAIVSFGIGCINLPIHLLLMGGAIFKSPCLMLPWLAVMLLEHLVLGVPMIVFFGIISLYMAAQLKLYIVAGAIIGSIVVLFLVSLSSWFTVYACYNELYRRQDYYYESPNCSAESTQPLLSSGRGGHTGSAGPALPPGHPNGYPHYYPPHHQTRQLPSAPPVGHGGMYPQLPNA